MREYITRNIAAVWMSDANGNLSQSDIVDANGISILGGGGNPWALWDDDAVWNDDENWSD